MFLWAKVSRQSAWGPGDGHQRVLTTVRFRQARFRVAKPAATLRLPRNPCGAKDLARLAEEPELQQQRPKCKLTVGAADFARDADRHLGAMSASTTNAGGVNCVRATNDALPNLAARDGLPRGLP